MPYQATIMDKFVFNHERCTTNQLIDACILDNGHKIIAATFHFMETT